MLGEISFGQMLLGMLYFFFLFMFIWVFISILSDLFRDHEISGWGKAIWVIFLIFLPFLASIIYLIVRGGGMAKRSMAAQAAAQKEFNEYVQQTAAAGSPAQELERLSSLKENGTISDDEYDKLKAKIVG